jgi:hypothetical protein
MAVNTAAGTRISIGPKAGRDLNKAGYEALTFVEVGEVEDAGEFGDASNPVTFTALADRRTRKFKGTRDAGDMTLVIGFDAGDAGQIALIAAEQDDSPSDFAFKVEFNDGDPDATPTAIPNTIKYFVGKAMSFKLNTGNADNIVRANVPVAVNSEIIDG